MIKRQLLVIVSVLITSCGGSGVGGGGGAASVPASAIPASSASASSVAVSSSSTSSSSNASSGTSTGSTSSTGSLSISQFIVTDQFGYLPNAQKIAVIRDPQTGYDAAQSFAPSATLSLVDMTTNQVVLSAAPHVWSAGATDTSSGDKAWWFDFSSVTMSGTYAVVDSAQGVRSPTFKIASDVYKPVLKEAFRTYFYQRAGFAKQVPFANAAWADAASHIGLGQDKNARIYNAKSDASTERDLSGGWYDAGDYNKYTSWAAEYVTLLLHAYLENPAAWGDDFNIPESGNGIPDILDEVKWGTDWLIKMQNATGNNSVLSIVSLSSSTNTPNVPASPPSLATGASYYGPATTNATLSTAAALAFASKVFGDTQQSSLASYAADLKARAENAWTWANANPSVIFYNNDDLRQPGSGGIGAGQQEVDDAGRALKKRLAAVYLYAATSGGTYKSFIESNYTFADLKNFSDPFRETENTSLLYYANLPGVSTSVANDIKTWFKNDMNNNENWNAMTNKRDPYLAYLGVYVWGSNSNKSAKGTMFMDILSFGISGFDNSQAKNNALTYVNYLHGVNPQGMVYLSNMYALGVHNSVNEFYHSWFIDGSAKWDRVGTSTFGPAPGFLVGGPNPSYDWDVGNCTGLNPNSGCGSAAPNPPKGQPPQKSYKDFNTSWPLNSWSVTENSCGYQANYLRLLSKFVN